MLKYLSPILLTVAIILATVAIILPNWVIQSSPAKFPGIPTNVTMDMCNEAMKKCQAQTGLDCNTFMNECKMAAQGQDIVVTSGLWSICDNVDNKCKTWGDGKTSPEAPKDIVVSQVTSITGVVLLGIGMLCILMSKTLVSKLVIGLGVACLTAALIVFGVVTKPDKMKDAKFNTSFWLEMSAAILGLITVFLPSKK